MTKAKKTQTESSSLSPFERKDNGNIEVILTINGTDILKEKDKVLKEFSEKVNIPGFRKGKAPITKVEQVVSEEDLSEHILEHILPVYFANAVSEYKFTPAMYPRFEAIKITASKNVDASSEWQIKAITCELPKVKLEEKYKEAVLKTYKNIEKESKAKEDEVREIKESRLINAILKTITINVPEILITEEVNGRFAQLLQRVEKLGLELEGYLKSVGKDIKTLRSEYETEAKNAISLELILNEIANIEKLDLEESKVDEFIKSTGSEIAKVSDEQRKMLRRILLRREALEVLYKLL